jgi:hypothetical protein
MKTHQEKLINYEKNYGRTVAGKEENFSNFAVSQDT